MGDDTEFCGFKIIADPSVPEGMILVKDDLGKTLLSAALQSGDKGRWMPQGEPMAWTTRDLKDGKMVFATQEKAQDWVRQHFQDEGATITPLYALPAPPTSEAI